MIKLKVDEAAVIPLHVDTDASVPMSVTEAFIDKGGVSLQTNKNASASSSQVVVTPDVGYDGMEKVTIAAIPSGALSAPSISVSTGGLITATAGVGTEGYVLTSETASSTSQLTTQAAQTIYPSTSDQSIASGKYLTGAQTVKAVVVSGLTADKVLTGTTVKIGDAADDDRIMKVVGTATSGVTPTGTKNISITQNGTTTEDVTNYATASITANVPNTYAAGDEGKVVSGGALVSQTSDTVTTNNTYDTTLINSLTVNVSGGGGGTTVIMTSTASNVVACGTQIFGTLSANKMYHASLVEKAQSDWIQDQLLIIMKIGASSSSGSGDAIRWRDNNYSDAPYANNWAANVAIGDKYEVFETEY